MTTVDLVEQLEFARRILLQSDWPHADQGQQAVEAIKSAIAALESLEDMNKSLYKHSRMLETSLESQRKQIEEATQMLESGLSYWHSSPGEITINEALRILDPPPESASE